MSFQIILLLLFILTCDVKFSLNQDPIDRVDFSPRVNQKLLVDIPHWDNLRLQQSNAYQTLQSHKSGIDDSIDATTLEDVKLQEMLLDPTDPLIFMNVEQLILTRGYPFQQYKVTTTDGFILTIHRIPSQNDSPSKIGKVVLLQHGLLCSAADWVMDDKDNALAFVLHDAGYDVWLGNIRGNIYSKEHITLTPDHSKFWDWSFQEMAAYDLPAMVDFILNQTGVADLYYVGHSQGTMIGFSGFTENSDLASKIKTFYALAPVAFLGHVKSPIRFLGPISNNLDSILDILGVDEFSPNTAISKKFASDVCGTTEHFNLFCTNMMFLLAGFNKGNMRDYMIPVYAAHDPAGTSSKNIVHFAQLIYSNTFQKFDFGTLKNIITYGHVEPPSYDFTKFNVPVMMFWGNQDWLAAPQDVSKLITLLNTVKASHRFEDYNHVDFLWGKDAKKRVYSKILEDMAAQE